VTRFREHLGLTRCHIREIALYEHPDRRLRDHSPHVFAVHRDDEAREWTLILESVDDAVLINAADNTTRWNDATIDAALAGMAKIHAVWYNRTDDLAREPWLAPARDARRRREMLPLWSALADHAAERSSAWSDARLRRLHARLASDVSSWASELDGGPLTLIHNDFNPRNIAIRRTSDGLKLCAFDWELAAVGIPQRDLAELLAFVLPPDAPLAAISRWIERSRALLEAETGTRIERAAWSRGFSAALCDLLVDRLAFYAMIDRVRPQQFLPRVVRSWSNLHRYYPWS
jgi:hydroxymethylglutaryl-CoA reductase (NADPH)